MFPEIYTVKHEALLKGATDDWGDPIESFAPAVDVPIYGWAPAADDEIRDLGTGEKYDFDLYCATAFCAPGDRVLLPGQSQKVDVATDPEDFNFGPFGFKPGYRVRLKRVEG